MATAKVEERYIVKVAEGEKGSEDVPSVGPTYKSIYSDSLPLPPENVQSCWDVFRYSEFSDRFQFGIIGNGPGGFG